MWNFSGDYLNHFGSSPKHLLLIKLGDLDKSPWQKGAGITGLVKMLLELKLTQQTEPPQTHCNYLLSHRHKKTLLLFSSRFCCPQLKNKHLTSARKQRENLLECSHEGSREFNWMNLYRKGNLNINAVNEFS